MIRNSIKPIYAVLAAGLLALVVMPLAFAGAAGSGASSAKVTEAKFKKLKQRIAQLETREIAASGPAGGDLTGNYPNPIIEPNALGSEEVINDSLGAADIAEDAIGASESGPDSVGQSEIVNEGVGAGELKQTYVVVTGGLDPAAGYVNQSANCQGNDIVLSGGFSWDTDTAATVVFSTPDPLFDPNKWVARGGNTSAGNTFRAWAVCLRV